MVAIIKYNAGNISSVKNALRRLGCESTITDNAATIKAAEKVIFPGVGEASSAMQYLKEKELDKMGICLGLQLMCKHTEEANTKCLNIFDANVKLFPPKELVPHIGWNSFENVEGDLFKGVATKDDVYFVHSYYAETCNATVAILVLL